MKKLIFGSAASSTNINKVTVTQTDNNYHLKINLEVLPNQKSSRSFLRKEVFVLACYDPSIISAIVKNNSKIIPYLTRQQESSAVAYTVSGLVGRRMGPRLPRRTTPSRKLLSIGKKKGEVKNLHIKMETISELVVFAGTINHREIRGRGIYSLGSIDTLTVFKDGGVPNNNMILYEDEKRTKIWVGQAFQDTQNNWYKQSLGPYQSADRLFPMLVPNTKVIYQSELDAQLLKQVSNNFDSLFLLNRKINSKQAVTNKLKTETRNYFSSLYAAKTINLSLPLSFSFNRLDFFRNNGAFSKLIKNENEMIDSFELLSTRILRKRVVRNNPTNKLTGAGPTQAFDGIEHVVAGGIQYPSLVASKNVLTVTTSDPEMDQITYGLYTYGVEFTFLDNTYQKLQSALKHPDNGLRKAIYDVKNIYNDILISGNYDAYEGSLSDAYLSRYQAQGAEDKIQNAVITYVSIISLFHKNLEKALKTTPNVLASNLYSLADPLTHGPSGVSSLLQLLEDMESEVLKHIKMSTYMNAGDAAVLQTQTSRLGTGARIIKIKHYFDEVIDADDMIVNGFDYLTAEIGNNANMAFVPFRQVSYNQLQQLITIEESKYDNLSISNFGAISLTPNYFKADQSVRKINSQEPNQEEEDAVIASTLLAANKYRNSPLDLQQFDVNDDTMGASTNLLSILKNNLKVIEKESCTISVNLQESDAGIFGAYGAPLYPASAQNYLDAAEKMSEPSPFVINKTGSVSLNEFMLHTINNVSQEKYYTKLQHLNNHFLSFLVQTDYYTNSMEKKRGPVKNITDKKVFRSSNVNVETFKLRSLEQSKKQMQTSAETLNTLLLGTQEKENITAQEMNYANYITSPISASSITTAALRYGKIRKIEYLAGFKKINDSVMMKKPFWVSLSTQTLESLSLTGKSILCRMQKINSEFSDYRGIEFPIYDEYFMIGPANLPPVEGETLGNASFVPLPRQNFDFIEKIKTEDNNVLKYSTGITSGRTNSEHDTSAGSSPPAPPPTERPKNTSLYTNGGDFLLPTGEKYIGYYHIHLNSQTGKYVAMEGEHHRDVPHKILKPVSERAHRQLAEGGATENQNGLSAPTNGPIGY